MSRVREKSVKSQGIWLWILSGNPVVEGLYYPYSENKGPDQLRSYCAADLPLCFPICKSRFSHNEAHVCM